MKKIRSNDGIPRIVDEFWTSRQRQASSLHEVSYRACFKPQLPRFFIERFTVEDDLIYDPFMGRGTTVIEAALMNRNVIGNDVNPLSALLCAPRLDPPEPDEVLHRLHEIPFEDGLQAKIDLSMFYHEKTVSEIISLKRYLNKQKSEHREDAIDAWIRMVATNRLTGHSKGFFSVYTLPPNQAASPENQRKINSKRNQTPEQRDVKGIIQKKSSALLKDLTIFDRTVLEGRCKSAHFLTCDARSTPAIPSDSVALTVTSPPFLNVVQYAADNWLRCWFNSIDAREVGKGITTTSSLLTWSSIMRDVFNELYRITRIGGHVAFEVGEVNKGTIQLDEEVVPLGRSAGFRCEAIYINTQEFTKTANIWGVSNNTAGTNTNRIVVFKKS